MKKLELNIQRFADDNKVSILIETNKKGTGVEDTQKSLSNLSKLTSGLTSGLKKLGVAAGFKELTSGIIKATKTSSDYVETLNLLDAAYQNNTKSIKEFASNISDTLNLDDKTILQSAAHFKTLTQSMGIANETGEKLAKLMTQMTLDVSSLYNLDFDNAQRALQYAMEGRGTSLKQQTGVSVLETSVQTTLNALGVDAYVEDMNDSEKALARVITMEYQLMASQGDLAQTIEAPANQFRVLGEQVAMVGRNIGNIFLPMMAAILPYVNAVLIVINKLISALATLFGYDPTAWDVDKSNVEAFEGLGSAVDGVGGSMGKAGKAADDLKNKLKGLRGFDKLNVINTPQDNAGGGGSGGGGGGGINPALLKAFDDMFGKYNDMLDGVKTKASQIAEAFMAWLSILEPLEKPLKEIAGLTFTGIIYVWENVLKPLGQWAANTLLPEVIKTLASYLEVVYAVGRNLLPIYKTLMDYVIIPFGRSIGNAVIGALKDIRKILNWMSKSKLAITILSWVAAFKQLKFVMAAIAKIKIAENLTLGRKLSDLKSLLFENSKGVSKLTTGWKNFITLVSPSQIKITDNMTKFQTATTKLSNKISALKTAAKGAVAAFAGFEILKGAFQDIVKHGTNLGNVLGVIAGAITMVAGAMVVLNAAFAAFGKTLMTNPIFLVAGAITAAIVAIAALSKASEEHSDFVKRLDESYKNYNNTMKEINNSFEQTKKQSEENYLSRLAELQVGEQYVNQLGEILDENGRVQSGKETQAKEYLDKISEYYGTEYELQDGVIKLGDEIIDNKGKLISITDELAAKVEKQALLEAYEAQYKEAVIAQMKAKQAYNDVMDEQNSIIEQTLQKLKNHEITATEAEKVVTEATNKQTKEQKKYDDTIKKTNDTINRMGDVSKAYANGSAEDMKTAMNAVTNETKKASTKQKDTFKDNTKALRKEIDKQKEIAKELNESMKGKHVTWTVELDTTQCRKNWNSLVSDMGRASGGSQVKIGTPAKLPVYAQGGLPSVGQMFIANERGPELVGQIGGQSFVANQNQMLDIIDRKLSNAGGLQNATFVIQVGSEEVARTVLKDLNSMAKSNGKPITINGS